MLGPLDKGELSYHPNAHTAAARCSWEPLADHLMHLADLAREVETALVGEAY